MTASPDLDMNGKLLFIISPPRSGSTMLARILASHPQIYGRPEPQLVPPLFQLGYYGTVADSGVREGTGAFHPGLATDGIKAIVEDLPHGEDDYLDALRAYLNVLYGRLLTASGKSLFVDKTPRNALYVDFIVKLFPASPLVILARNPLAVAVSLRTIFFTGIHHGIPISRQEDRVLAEVDAFSRALASCIRSQPAPSFVLRYEDLVAEPEVQVAKLCDFLGLTFAPEMIDYGAAGQKWDGPGDPVLVKQRSRPTSEAVDKWSAAVRSDPDVERFLRRALDVLRPEDIQAWGYDPKELAAQLDAAAST
jgi:hypothetical protein